MKTETVHNGIRYTLSNEGLKLGDKVYPIAGGRCLDDGGWILHNFDFRDFPEEAHKILDLNHSNYQPYEIRTDYGFGPMQSYYKIVKAERLVEFERFPGAMFKSHEWRPVDDFIK